MKIDLPKVLLFDVESFPNEGWTWGVWDQKVIKVIKRKMICSIAWSWYPNRTRHVLALPDFDGYDPKDRNNRELMKAFSRVIDKSDVAIGHNINEFDDKSVNSDVFLNKLDALPDHLTIDTLKVLRSRFNLNSNRLDDVCQELGIGKKLKHPGFKLWEDCMAGVPSAWKKMKAYNQHDVDPLLRGLYEHLRPWIRNHPNMGDGGACCPKCTSPKLKPWSHHHTLKLSYQRMWCMGCRSWIKKIKSSRGGFVYRA